MKNIAFKIYKNLIWIIKDLFAFLHIFAFQSPIQIAIYIHNEYDFSKVAVLIHNFSTVVNLKQICEILYQFNPQLRLVKMFKLYG